MKDFQLLPLREASLNNMIKPEVHSFKQLNSPTGHIIEKVIRTPRPKPVLSEAAQQMSVQREQAVKTKNRQLEYAQHVKRNFQPSISRLADETMISLKVDSHILPSLRIEERNELEFQNKTKTLEIGNKYLAQSRRFFSKKRQLMKANKVVEVQNKSQMTREGQDKRNEKTVLALTEKPRSLNAMTNFINVLDRSRISTNLLSKEVMGQIRTALKSVDHMINVEKKPDATQYLSSIRMKLALMEQL